MMVKYKILRNGAKAPSYQSDGAAGADLYACDTVEIPPHERRLIPTGIAIECERRDIAAIICARSGLATKHGIALANGIGVVDSDYRGEIMVSCINLSDKSYTVMSGERIAQLMLVPVAVGKFIEGELSETERGNGGFGSTGSK